VPFDIDMHRRMERALETYHGVPAPLRVRKQIGSVALKDEYAARKRWQEKWDRTQRARMDHIKQRTAK
jgi:hypothetical protein